MTTPLDARGLRVRRVLAVTRRIADREDPLGVEVRARLGATSGLSSEGVDLALAECLETDVSPDDLARIVRRAGSAEATWIVASANVCTAAARAIAVAVATSARVLVKPSRRDPVLAEILVRELSADASFAAFGGTIALVSELAPAPGDEVHAYGRDETIAKIAASIPEGVVLRGHGAGFGIAVVEDDADVARAAMAIARDVVPFDQRGCLSPRVVLCGGSITRATELAAALHGELAGWRSRVPPGVLDEAERTELAVFRRTMEALGQVYGDEWTTTVAMESSRSLPLPPAARTLVVVALASERIESLFGSTARFITAIGADNGNGALARALTLAAPLSRIAPLGEMQRPALDGPVDLRHLRG